ncbi:alpha/beta-hydrolase [Mycena leptocephala]|nr:alpha/beta-hydrolase [Mycena leptocephala]
MDLSRYKQLKTQRGFTYSYYWSPPATGKPVLFFAHGFPEGSFLWRKQVPFFEPLGYGLFVPELLGYGGTDKPTDPKLYIGSGHAHDIVDILDAEGRVSACVFLAGSYAPPLTAGADRISQYEQIKERFGYDVYAYMRFFVQPDAPAIIEKHIDSFISLLYPETIQLWKDYLCVDGGARAWIENNKQSPLPWYMTPRNGISAPLCWYRSMIDQATYEDDAKISPEAAEVKQPLLFVAFTGDCVSLPILADTSHAKYAKGPVTRKEIGGDHWGLSPMRRRLTRYCLNGSGAWISDADGLGL